MSQLSSTMANHVFWWKVKSRWFILNRLKNWTWKTIKDSSVSQKEEEEGCEFMAFSKLKCSLSLNWLTGKPTNWQEIWQPEKTLCREQRWLRLLRRASEVASERDECRTDGRMRWEVEKDRRVESFSDRREATRLLLLMLLSWDSQHQCHELMAMSWVKAWN